MVPNRVVRNTQYQKRFRVRGGEITTGDLEHGITESSGQKSAGGLLLGRVFLCDARFEMERIRLTLVVQGDLTHLARHQLYVAELVVAPGLALALGLEKRRAGNVDLARKRN